MIWVMLAAWVTVVLVGLAIYMRHWERETVDEFRRRFPGRCFICSLHRWGFQHGHEASPTPPAHDCIEQVRP